MDTCSGKAIEPGNQRNMRHVALVLAIVGLVLLFFHYLWNQEQPRVQDEVWLLGMDIRLQADRPDTVINIQRPYERETMRVVRHTIAHAGLRVSPPARPNTDTRGLRLRAINSGVYQVHIEYELQLSPAGQYHAPRAITLSEQQREQLLMSSKLVDYHDPVFDLTLSGIDANSPNKDENIRKIFGFVAGFSSSGIEASLRPASVILNSRVASYREQALLMIALCRKSGIPSRQVSGVVLTTGQGPYIDTWMEAYIEGKWVPYHPGLGYTGEIPFGYIALDKTGHGIVSSIVHSRPNTETDHTASIALYAEKIPETVSTPNNLSHEWYRILILDRLPAEARDQLSLLLLLPIGALLCSLIRQLGGLHSYGVFTPTILALAISYTDWVTTTLLVGITLTLVYFGRPTFHRGMSRTPRLSIIFTLVAISMAFGVSALDFLSLSTGDYLVLLPMVVITSLLDRFFSSVELLGYRTAIIRLVWTLILTAAVLPILHIDWLGRWLLSYPETHLFTMALLVLVACYPFKTRRLAGWLSVLSEPETTGTKKRSKKISQEED